MEKKNLVQIEFYHFSFVLPHTNTFILVLFVPSLSFFLFIFLVVVMEFVYLWQRFQRQVQTSENVQFFMHFHCCIETASGILLVFTLFLFVWFCCFCYWVLFLSVCAYCICILLISSLFLLVFSFFDLDTFECIVVQLANDFLQTLMKQTDTCTARSHTFTIGN